MLADLPMGMDSDLYSVVNTNGDSVGSLDPGTAVDSNVNTNADYNNLDQF